MRLVDLALVALSACVALAVISCSQTAQVQQPGFCRLYILCLLQKVPPTTVAPTYKLTLPSEFVLTHMPDMMAGDFGMISADGTQSFTVSIVPRWAELAHCCALTSSIYCAVESDITTNTCCHAGGIRTNLSTLCKPRLGSRYELLLHLFGRTRMYSDTLLHRSLRSHRQLFISRL